MQRRRSCTRSGAALALALLLAGGLADARAQGVAPATPPTLRGAFEAAWLRQPEAQALAARREAARAQARAAEASTPEPVALSLSHQTDRLNRNLGTREFEVGVAIPLWLRGERGRSQALAEAEARAVDSRAVAAQLRVAAAVREAWWSWHRAHADREAARGQLDSVRRIAADVARRLKAGDLARADQHQAEGAVAAAEAAVAQADGALMTARQHLLALTALTTPSALPDLPPAAEGPAGAEAEPPAPPAGAVEIDAHAELQALQDRAAVAEGSIALAAVQARAHPELTIAATRDRGGQGEAYQHSVTIGLRIPFGAGARHDARVAAARAEALDVQAQMALERARLAAERESARARTEAAKAQLAAAERRAQLARESRGFFDKSFRLGQTDLPTRLRIEAEAADAERQASRARIELAAAISAWRQALGLLPS